MRAGTQWRQWQQLGRAVRASHFPAASSPEANLIKSTFLPQSRSLAAQTGKPQGNACASKVHDSSFPHGDPTPNPNPNRVYTKLFSHAPEQEIGGQSSFSMSNSGYADPGSRRLYCLNPNRDRLPWFKLSPGRTQVSNASSREPDYWDPPESNPPPSKRLQEGSSMDQNGLWERERHLDQERERDRNQDLDRDRRSMDDGGRHDDHRMMAGDNDGVNWGQKHVRVREYETRQRAGVAPIPPPKYQPNDVYIPVKACYVSRSVDLKRLSEEPFLEITSSRNNLIIRFANRAADAPPTSNRPGVAEISRSQEKYMVAFQYGSIVFFNFGDEEEEEALSAVRKFCTDEFRETRKDDYGVLVRPTLPEWSEGGQDQIMLRMLDTDNIRVISSILGQSIALDHYAKKVDEMVNTFSELNRGMEKTGTFTMTRKSLFQLVAAANTTLADVILRLGLLERSDAAWKDANYAQIWEYLRDDFELDERFESLDFKLNIIQHNVRFFLEILQNRKSDTLEWIIILLITGEICVSLYDILHTAHVI